MHAAHRNFTHFHTSQLPILITTAMAQENSAFTCMAFSKSNQSFTNDCQTCLNTHSLVYFALSQPEQSESNVSSGIKRYARAAELPDEDEQRSKFQQVEGLTTVDAEEIPYELVLSGRWHRRRWGRWRCWWRITQSCPGQQEERAWRDGSIRNLWRVRSIAERCEDHHCVCDTQNLHSYLLLPIQVTSVQDPTWSDFEEIPSFTLVLIRSILETRRKRAEGPAL